MRCVDATYCYKPNGMVYQSVCWSVTEVSPAKMAEPIKMPFGLRIQVDPRNRVLDGVKILQWRGNFKGE